MGILKHKIIFAKGSTPNWSDEVFVIKNVKNNVIKKLMLKKLSEQKRITKDKWNRV